MNNLSYEKFYIPAKADLPLSKYKLDRWYANLLAELFCLQYSDEDCKLLQDKRNYYGKYIDDCTRRFFLNHFARNLSEAINFLSDSFKETFRIFEIGCGCGNQLLLMALLGAEVIGCDIRPDVCNLAQKRKIFYEKLSGRKLDITVICEDVLCLDKNIWGEFDAVNFLFSFNDIKPGQKVLKLVNYLLKPGGRLVIQETNPINYYNRFFRRRDILSPYKIAQILEEYGFKIDRLKGGYVLPPLFWQFMPSAALSFIDEILCRSIFLSVSYQLMAEKCD